MLVKGVPCGNESFMQRNKGLVQIQVPISSDLMLFEIIGSLDASDNDPAFSSILTYGSVF